MTPRKVTDKAKLTAFDNADGGTTSRYPWAEWTDGGTYQATKGQEFNGQVASFKYLLRAQATKRQMVVKIQADGDDVIFRFTKAEPKTTDETK